MIKFAITGGIGSGKSYASSLLEERGIPIYNADLESKRLTMQDEGIRKELVALLDIHHLIHFHILYKLHLKTLFRYHKK